MDIHCKLPGALVSKHPARFSFLRSACVALMIMAAPPAFAAESYEQLFESMKSDPTNPNKTFRFAQAAIKAGDINGAIAALERMLLSNPGLSNIELELGVLYLRVGAVELASEFIDSALRAPEVPPWVRERAQGLLGQAERASSRHSFSTSLFLAAKHDSNANAAPAGRLVRIRGFDGLLDEDDTGRSDTSTEFALRVRHYYDLNSQAGHQLETSLGTYNRVYEDVSEIDVNSFGITTGPRFYFGQVLNPSWSVRPLVTFNQLYLDGDLYLRSTGLGINTRKSFSSQLLGELTLSGEDQRYENDEDTPNATDRSGKFYELSGSLSYVVKPRWRVSTQLAFNQRDANEDFESLQRGSLRIASTYSYKAPWNLSASAWSFTAAAEIQEAEYDEADPLIDPDEERNDTRMDFSLSNSIPLGKAGTLVLSTQYTDNDSSLPNYVYDNWSGSLGWSYNF